MTAKKSSKNNYSLLFLIALVLIGALAYFSGMNKAKTEVKGVDVGFNQYGYNYKARIFNGTGESWSIAKGLPADYLGAYSKDKLVMKWNAEWDRGNLEGWTNPPYDAWENNEWNGNTKGGSGAVWKYKIVWVGNYTTDPSLIPSGGYGIWGQFAVISDQGKDPNYGPGHLWFAHASPNGYGSYTK